MNIFGTCDYRSSLKYICIAIFLILVSPTSYAENTLKDIKVTALADENVEIVIEFENTPTEPLSFTTDNPARIALDFADTNLAIKERFQDINIGATKTINSVQSKGRSRIVVNLSSLQEYQTEVKNNLFIVRIGQGETIRTAQTSTAAPVTPKSSPSRSTANTVDQVDFRRGDNSTGRVIIGISNSDTPISLSEQGGRIILDFDNSQLPEALQQRYDVTDFATPVNTVEAFTVGDKVRVVVQPDTNLEYEHLAYQSDNLYVLEVREIPEEVLETRRREVFEGERLSLNFQNIEVRSVLQLIADFTDLNLVVSDSVGGSLTLRLKNVPWDQALDIILRTKGLGMRENGSVIYIAPNEEIAAREKLELEAQQQVEELAPLRSEFFVINYANATDFFDLLRDTENTLLSERGQVTVDSRTNTLLVQDTAQKLNELRRLINRLDVPVKQVLIESRIVVANDDFSRDLGARFGVFNVDGGDLGLGRTADITGGNLNLLEPLTAGDPIPLEDTLNVDLPVAAPAGQFALAFLKLPLGFLIDLELSAAQAESRAEVISNPRIITSNQNTARIEQGTEIGFQSQTSSGATDIEFKDAVLSLEVTPQITPDDRVNMDLQINNDTVGEILAGVPSIDTTEISTNVLVDNGQTIVLGGIYEENATESTTRVPFFSDIPLVGRLFRTDSLSNEKAELLIFITPKIIDEQLSLTR